MAPLTSDLSLRHLPDLSDASVSFQIPLETSGDFLLANEDDDFLKDVEDSLSTPAPPRRVQEPLTLSELTPRARSRPGPSALQSPSKNSPSRLDKCVLETAKKTSLVAQTHSDRPSPKPKLTIATQALTTGSPVAQRFESLKTEVETLVHDPSERASQMTSSRERSKAKAKRTLIAGGISKAVKLKSKLPASSFTRSAATSKKVKYQASHPTNNISRQAANDCQLYSDVSAGDMNATSTARVVSDDHTVLSSAEPADISGSSIGAPSASSPRIIGPEPNPDPFRLSEISPSKGAVSSNAAAISSRVVAGSADGKQRFETTSKTAHAAVGLPKQSAVRITDTTRPIVATKQPIKRLKANKPILSGIKHGKTEILPILSKSSNNLQPSSVAPCTSTPNSDEQLNTTIGDGVAARLMMYSQNLMPPSDLPILENSSDDSRLGRASPRDDTCLASTSSLSITGTKTSSLSQDKVDISALPLISPMRLSRKRPSTTLDPDDCSIDAREPKSRRVISSSSNNICGSSKPGPALQPSLHENSATVSAYPRGSAQTKSKSSHASLRSRGDMHHGKEKEDKTVWPSLATVAARQDAESRDANKLSTGTRRVQSDNARKITSKPGLMPHFENPVMVLPLSNPTKPIGFNFQLDMRMEGRKTDVADEKSRRAKPHNPLPVPDFKTLHLAHEAALAARKEAITPIIPLPTAGELNTEARAREREKFDEDIRRKEVEMERQRQLRQREREEEEEREVRELRKRAVPRAHVVPEWYAAVPKRERVKKR